MSNPDDVVRAMVESWNALQPDPEKFSKFFAEDAVWHNIPMEPAVGRDAIRGAFVGFVDRLDKVHFEIHLQVASGNVVMNERTDTFTVDGRVAPLRVMGVFEVADGFITAWRDYFDLAEASSALGF